MVAELQREIKNGQPRVNLVIDHLVSLSSYLVVKMKFYWIGVFTKRKIKWQVLLSRMKMSETC